MARGDQLGRQWKIIQTLISSRKGKSAADLANNLDCHPRTVYRDLEALQIAGFPVYTDKQKGRTLWSILDTLKNQIPIPFNLAELMALYFSRDMLKILKDTVYYDSLESLFQKIKTTLPREYMESLAKMEKSLQVGLKPHKDYTQSGDVMNTVSQAVVNGYNLEIEYFTMSRKKRTRRRVAPYKIWFFDGTFYLIGYCHLRKAIRLFAIDRIKRIKTTGQSFDRPSDTDINDIMKSSFGVFLDKPVKVRVRFASDIAGYIKEKIWHETQKIVELDNGDIIFEAEIAGLHEIQFWLMTWGAKAYVLEPEALRAAICAEAKAILAEYRVKPS